MARLLFALLLGTSLALAQERDDEGITIDEPPTDEATSGPEKEPKRTTPYPAREAGTKVATVAVKRKAFSLQLPADWVLLDADDSKAEVSWEVLLPGSTTRASLALLRQEAADARSWPYYQAEWVRKEKPDHKAEVRPKPVPRVVVRRPPDGTDWVDVYFCVSVRNNLYLLQLTCADADFAQAEADLVVAARSFAADVPIWPPIPQGYETAQEGIWLVARAPSVKASVAPIVKALKDQEKRFRKDHGALPKTDAPIVVLVHATKAEAAKLDPRLAETERDFVADTGGRRLFALPLPKGNLEREAFLAAEAQGLLLMARYGDVRPAWVYVGECTVARAEVHTGKPLPSLHEGYVAWASTLKLHRLDELDALEKSDPDAWNKEAFFHVAALREGKHKKAYHAFLDDFAESGDAVGALARHLGSIDQEELRASTNQWISTKIRSEKPK